VGIPSMVGFRAFMEPSSITEPFTNFSFTRWNLGYHEALNEFLTWWNFGYHRAFHELLCMMEFRLSQSLSQTFLSHDGISAITEPFTIFLSHDEIWAIIEPFTNFSHGGLQDTWFGGRLLSYITKSISIGSASLKTSPLDLEPPLEGKEYDPPYSKLNAKFKCFCFWNHL
jgi:hypothetical protein